MRKLRLLLFPFAGLYYVITLLRSKLYDLNLFSSKEYALPVICIGNLSTGGTGKSPMTEYMIRLLKDDYNLATLSRGYGRSTKGYLDVISSSLATQVGDEPLQFAQKFNDIHVAVCEDRQTGIERLIEKGEKLDCILLDDAYQHRKVKAGFYIVLTSYKDLYSKDYLLPSGNLREPRSGAKRANVVVVTKCPDILSKEEQDQIEKSLSLESNQTLLFSKIVYEQLLYSERGTSQLNSLKTQKVTLVTGIANPKPLEIYLLKQGLLYNHKTYGDHHNFSSSEIEELDQLDCILTTEKDFVRLQPLLKKVKLYYLPIRVKLLDKGDTFKNEIIQYVSSFKNKAI